MRNIQNLIFLATALLVNGCSSITTVSFQDNKENQLPVLTAYQLENSFIEIETIGYGCTFQQDFTVAAVSQEDNMIEIIRTREDNCKMSPRNVALSYSFKHLNIDSSKPIKVLNQVKEPTFNDFAIK